MYFILKTGPENNRKTADFFYALACASKFVPWTSRVPFFRDKNEVIAQDFGFGIRKRRRGRRPGLQGIGPRMDRKPLPHTIGPCGLARAVPATRKTVAPALPRLPLIRACVASAAVALGNDSIILSFYSSIHSCMHAFIQ